MAKRKAAATRAKSTRKTSSARASRKTPARKAAARRTAGRKKASRKAARKGSARKASPPKRTSAAATRTARGSASKRKPATARGVRIRRDKPSRASGSAKQAAAPQAAVARKVPALNRARRVAPDDSDLVPTPPSTLDLDRTASAARSGRRELLDRFSEHTETSPALTAGDVDADWESAYAVGDEAPGGDNPTPDQDIVDDIGRAVGNEYQDTEELKGADKIARRDKHRWELDPASAEDWDER